MSIKNNDAFATSSLIGPKAAFETKKMTPTVLSLPNTNQRMGELTAANTKFELRAAPRVNCIQAALFTDKKQQINSPMFQRKANPAIYNDQAVRAGAIYIPDGQQMSYGSPMQSYMPGGTSMMTEKRTSLPNI